MSSFRAEHFGTHVRKKKKKVKRRRAESWSFATHFFKDEIPNRMHRSMSCECTCMCNEHCALRRRCKRTKRTLQLLEQFSVRKLKKKKKKEWLCMGKHPLPQFEPHAHRHTHAHRSATSNRDKLALGVDKYGKKKKRQKRKLKKNQFSVLRGMKNQWNGDRFTNNDSSRTQWTKVREERKDRNNSQKEKRSKTCAWA